MNGTIYNIQFPFFGIANAIAKSSVWTGPKNAKVDTFFSWLLIFTYIYTKYDIVSAKEWQVRKKFDLPIVAKIKSKWGENAQLQES